MSEKKNKLIKRVRRYGFIGVVLALMEVCYIALKVWVFNTWVSPDPIFFVGVIGVMFICGYVSGIDLALNYLEVKKTE